MADEHGRTDDGDDLDDGEVLDLGVLSEGIEASHGQWQSIIAQADHRRSRRAWVLSAAAAMILIAIAATLVLARGDDSGDLATGGELGGTSFVIPADGTVTSRTTGLEASPIDAYEIDYEDIDGRWSLARANSQVRADTDTVPGGIVGGPDVVVVVSTPFGSASLVCGPLLVEPTGDTRQRSVQGPYFVQFLVGTKVFTVAPAEIQDTGCDPSSAGAEALLGQLDRLRVVNEAQLFDYLDIDTSPTSTPPELQPSTTTTTEPDDPPDALDDDRAGVEAAIQGFDTQADDGSFPYLEDGVARAAEYKARQDAGSAAVGRTPEDKAGQVHTITSLTFVSGDEADVQFTIAVTLHGQRNTYQHVARVLRQDGHWVMARDSWFVIATVACGSSTYRSAYPDSCS